MYKLSKRSLNNLKGVHPDLVKIVKRALEISDVDYTVVEGLRTLETQRKYFNKGVSKTMKSKHLKQSDGFGHAVDLYPYYDGSVQVDADYTYFKKVADSMKLAADEFEVDITWGGDWKSFVDCPHFQLD